MTYYKNLETEYTYQKADAPKDTTNKYPVKKTQVTSYEDLLQTNPIDLQDPSNIKTEVEYDLDNNVYLFKTKIDNDEWVTPFSLNPAQYSDYSLKESMRKYFRKRNNEALVNANENKADGFSLKDLKLNVGGLERIFGPGGVQVKTQGYVELSAGAKHTFIDNPTLSQKNRSRTMIDFDEKIQMNVDASVGDKVNFGLNYDTEATFDFDSKKIKLAYEGGEDEIIKYLEAGNVSFNTTNSLITGGSALFGVRADLQFGKLKVNTILSQQESQSQTITAEGGSQTTSFEFKADAYDINQHFFIAQYFRDNFDKGMSKAPYPLSDVQITKMEVWVTNKNGNFDQSRNIIAFADLGEYSKIKNTLWSPQGSLNIPYNQANTLYSDINTKYPDARNINNVTQIFNSAGLVVGQDYEKIESARLLSSSEYQYNTTLGYISLTSALNSDEVLAVAIEYTYQSQTYKLGEFASEIPTKFESGQKSGALYLKLLKPTSLSPRSYTWDLMMKNVYKLGQRQVQKDKFRLQISYQNDSIGTYLNYITEGKINGELLLRVMGLDRLNANDQPYPDGIFDFISGYTIYPENGRVVFPVVEPFGKNLREKIGDDVIADKYVYQQLYDSTLTVAQQFADKNKFKISGTMRATESNSQINLNSMNVAQGSVKVTANGQTLVENVDYTVDYTTGNVTIINQSLIDSEATINITSQNQSLFNMQRRTLMGLNLSYEFSKNFNVGATIMHMYEKPLSVKTGIGYESLKNTVWGLNTSYKTESQWLTNLIDKLPFVNATAPSQISLNAEFAQMIPGHYDNKYSDNSSYLDDFESAKTKLSILSPYGWKIASTPYDSGADALFPNAGKMNDLASGNDRAHLAWFSIDPMFTRRTSSLRPSYLNNDSLSNHFVREINMYEIYPYKDIVYNESMSITTLNLSYYPQQRGMYNLDDVNIDEEGRLRNPEKRWGGVSRKIDNTDFEANNIEYIEFWLMDPFVYNNDPDAHFKTDGGDLYFNIGNVSEDILKDGKKFYENGLPIDNDATAFEYTIWGKVPTRQSTVYAFDNQQSVADRRKQDVGYSGLTDDEKLTFATYADYLQNYRNRLTATALARMQEDVFSPINDLTGDKYHYYRGSDYDRMQLGILDRYKYYNGVAGNSITDENESYSTAATTNPDVEDLNQDYTLNETESYYQYKISLKPDSMQLGKNYITDVRDVSVKLRNNNDANIKWYLFRVPIREYQKKIGNIQDFKTIRFARMFLTNFKQTTYLRFATLDFVKGDWRAYTQPLEEGINQGNGTLNIAAVNIEENGDMRPVNYVLPPGITRIVDPNQAQLAQENEQALSLQVLNLEAKDARAVYKNTSYDLRRYKRLQMFTHAEEIENGPTLSKGEVTVFLRLGSDYRSNYYEYEIPLTITPPAPATGYSNNSSSDRLKVWPEENMFNFPLKLLTNLKLNRNKEKRKAGSTVEYNKVYSEYDPDQINNKVSIIGNPSLSDVQVIMIGVRNNSRVNKSATIWVNELRVNDFDEEGGWAAQANLNINLSDIGTITLSGRKETSGFGAIDQGLMQRRQDDFYSYDIATQLDLGRFIPEKAKVSIPLYYGYSNQTTTPKYDPFDQDIRLSESLENVSTKAEKDSIKDLARDVTTTKNFSLNNVRVNIKSANPMPYDPANFTFGYASSIIETKNPTTVYDRTKNYKASLSYNYSPRIQTWQPFKNIKSKAPLSKYPKSIGVNFLPSNIAFNSTITRFYTETMTRDIESYSLGADNSQNQFFTWSQTFYWDRDFSINWDILKNLKISFNSGTRAEIEEPFLQVDKQTYYDDYDKWKDGIIRNIRNLGNPLSYKQNAKVTYMLPLKEIPFLDWVNSSANYESNYTWDRGAYVDSTTVLGNTITNSMTFSLKGDFEMTSLYNKFAFLKKVNDKFDNKRRRPTSQRRDQRKEPKKKPFAQDITLNLDSATLVKHGLKTKDIQVTAKKDNRPYNVKFKKVDENTIRITTKDTANIQINVVAKPENEKDGTLYQIAEYAARGLMSVRSFSVNYATRQETAIAGFTPGIGDFFGQKSGDLGMTPGLGFAFGFDQGEDYINKSLANNWLVQGQSGISPAVYNSIKKLEITADLEPARGLKIQLNALHERNDRTSINFNYAPNLTKTYGGSFSMTTISLASAFESSNADNNYKSSSFDKFLQNRDIIASRLENRYSSLNYPQSGFIPGTGINGAYDKSISGVSQYSADVLIPAFLSAYTGKSSGSISLSPFPAITALLPNWRINYDGLTTLPWFKEKFRSFKLSHGYTSIYSVGSYSSFGTWVQADGDFGFIENTDGRPTPSSPYDISSVNLIEQFNPLIGADGLLMNNMSIKARYNYSRMLNLNVTSFQIVENFQKDFVVGLGYKISEFNKILGIQKKSDRGFNNELNVNADFSTRTTQSLIRRIDDQYTDATAGVTILTLKLSAEYALSRSLLLRAFYDRIVNTPLISTSSYPTANTNFGVSFRFTLTQ